MGRAPEADKTPPGGLSGWGEAEGEAAAMSGKPGGTPGKTTTQDRIPNPSEKTGGEAAERAVAGMGEVEVTHDRRRPAPKAAARKPREQG